MYLLLLFLCSGYLCFAQVNKTRSNGVDSEFKNITCDFPAYDSSGNIKYRGEVFIQNSPNNTTSITIPRQNFTVSNTSNLDITNVTQIASPGPLGVLIGFPIILSPGGNATVYFEFSRPIGEIQTSLSFNYHETGFSDLLTNEFSNADLPNCICDCKNDWQYTDTEHKLNKFNVQGFPFNFQIAQSLKIVGVSPIMEVKAEVINVQHITNDPQCNTCVKQENKMGLFSFVPGFLKPRLSGSPNDWIHGLDADKGADINSDDYSNQAIWKAKDPTIGVDFSVAQRFILPVSLPDSSSLSCCEHTYKVCVRYTFTDINCVSCSYDQCYVSDGKTPTIDVGNSTGNLGTIKPNVKLKKN